MKKLNYLLLGAAGLVLASCSQEDLFSPSGGDVANVTLELTTPKIQSRSFSDGMSATKLVYAVYDNTGSELKNVIEVSGDDALTMENGKKRVTLQLAKDHSYSIVLWAANESAPYTVTFTETGASMTADYTDVNANDDSLDAFYKYEDLGVIKGDKQMTVQLTRPFAQINVGTNDYDAFEKTSSTTLKNSSIIVAKAHNVLNLIDGTVSGEANVEFKETAIPSRVATDEGYEKFPKEGYDYIAMAYVLVGQDKETLDVTFAYNESGKKSTPRTVSLVPLQRNHRTNIFGALLTGTYDLQVEILPDFEDDPYDKELVEVEDGKVKFDNAIYDNVNDALEAAKEAGEENPVIYAGETEEEAPIIVNDLDLSAKTRATGVAFKSVTIKGAGDPANTQVLFKNTGAKYINDSNFAINFENVTMKREKSTDYVESKAVSFIRIGQENYKNCIIEGTVMLFVNGSASFKDCKFNNSEKSGFAGYSIYYYAYSGSNVLVENCEFNTVSKAIVIYSETNNSYDLTVNNTKFYASDTDDKAAIQIHTEAADIYGTLRINGCTAEGFDPSRNNGLWFEEKNNAKPITPTYNFDVFVDGEQVQAKKGISIEGETVTSLKEAFEKVQDGGTVTLGGGNYNIKTELNGKWPTNKTVTLKGQGVDLTGLTDMDTFTVDGLTLNFEDLSIGSFVNILNHTSMGLKGANGASFKNVAINGEWHTYSNGDETFEDCIFNYYADSGTNYLLWHDGVGKTTLKNCTFNADQSKAILVYSNSGITTEMSDMDIIDCTFNSPKAGTKAAIEIHSEKFTKAGTINISNAKYDSNNFGKGLWREIVNAGGSVNGNEGDATKFYTIIVDGQTKQSPEQ